MDLAYIVEQNWRENVVEPGRHKAWNRAGTLIIAIWGHLVLDKNISNRVNYRGVSARENRGFTKVLTEETEARLWSKDGSRKDIDLETQSINGL